MKHLTSSIVALALLGIGSRSIGPKKIQADRFHDSHALADSWKHQMLLNIVTVRYPDLPILLDVGQLVSPDGSPWRPTKALLSIQAVSPRLLACTVMSSWPP